MALATTKPDSVIEAECLRLDREDVAERLKTLGYDCIYSDRIYTYKIKDTLFPGGEILDGRTIKIDYGCSPDFLKGLDSQIKLRNDAKSIGLDVVESGKEKVISKFEKILRRI